MQEPANFTVWMFLLTAQVLLAVRDRVDLHRKLGWFLAAWACLMGVMGPAAVYTVAMMQVKAHGGPIAYPFISVHVVDIGGFLVLLAIGIALRKNSAADKRMMILSSVALADPGFNRLIGSVYPADPQTPFSLSSTASMGISSSLCGCWAGTSIVAVSSGLT